MNMNARSNLAETATPVEVCKVQDLVPGIGICALVNGQQVAIFKLRNGDIHAIGNYDPFSEANVISRGLTGDLKGHKVVASPIYKQHFDLVTGQCLEEPDVSLPVYGVQVEGDRVLVLA
jgi:nitrite reductase (NADH) small subunit